MQTVVMVSVAASLSVCASASPLIALGEITDRPLGADRSGFAETAGRGGGAVAGAVVTMFDRLENYPSPASVDLEGLYAAPFSVLGPEGFVWGENRLRGLGDPFARLAQYSLGGATSQVVRLRGSPAQPPGGFFLGARMEFPHKLGARGAESAAVSAELYLSGIERLYTFESTPGRLLWGGTCVDSPPGACAADGLPSGPIPTMHALTVDASGQATTYFEIGYCTTETGEAVAGCVPHPGFAVGDAVTPPMLEWFRLRLAVRADGNVDFRMDRLDGAGETLVSRQAARFEETVEVVAINTSFESAGAVGYIDNITAQGALLLPASAPALACPYTDDVDWLFPGVLAYNEQRLWSVFPPADPVVLPRSGSATDDLAIREQSAVGDDVYRRQLLTALPFFSPGANQETVFSVDLRTTGPGTTRGVALFNNDSLVARVFLGYEDPDTGLFVRNVLVQTSGQFDPEHEAIRPGPGVLDTGFVFLNSASVYQTLTVRLSRSRTMTLLVDSGSGPVPIYFGRLEGSPVINRVVFESSNAASGLGARLYIDSINLVCGEPLFCPGDVTADGVIDFADLNAVLANFGDSAPGIPGDANGDFVVDFVDLGSVLGAFGVVCD